MVCRGSVVSRRISGVHKLDHEEISPENCVEVAVKMCKQGSQNSLRGLLSEIKIMMYLKKHANVVGIIGAYTQELDKGKLKQNLIYTNILFLEKCEN